MLSLYLKILWGTYNFVYVHLFKKMLKTELQWQLHPTELMHNSVTVATEWALLNIHLNRYKIASVFAKINFTVIVFAAGDWQCSRSWLLLSVMTVRKSLKESLTLHPLPAPSWAVSSAGANLYRVGNNVEQSLQGFFSTFRSIIYKMIPKYLFKNRNINY